MFDVVTYMYFIIEYENILELSYRRLWMIAYK